MTVGLPTGYQKGECPGEDLNLHVPKDTSPSSYEGSVDNDGDCRDLSMTSPPRGDHFGDKLSEECEVTTLPEANGENPEMAVLVDLLITFTCQERTQIISELSKAQRCTIAHMIARRLMRAKADGA
jgi:hypothetical protein